MTTTSCYGETEGVGTARVNTVDRGTPGVALVIIPVRVNDR